MRRIPVALLVAACAYRPPVIRADSWRELRTDHFSLTTDLDPGSAAQLIRRLERARAVMLALLWRGAQPPVDVTQVIAFASKGDLQAIAPSSDVLGFVAPDSATGQLLMVTVGDPTGKSEGSDATTVLQHELTHHLSARFFARQPRWFAEGLAGYFETLRIDEERGTAQVGLIAEPRMRLLQALTRKRRLPEFDAVINDAAAYMARAGYEFESLAWLLVHWLVNNDPQGLDAYLARLTAGEDAAAAFAASFPDLPVGEIRGRLQKYVLHGKYRTRTTAAPAWEGTISSRRVDIASVHAMRAQLLRLRGPAGDEAVKAELAEALRADPANPLALLISHSPDASPAVAAHPDDWRSWAALSQSRKGDLEAMEKAVQLAPGNAALLSRVGLLRALAGRHEEGIDAAVAAVKLEPGSPDLLRNLAALLAMAGHCEEAGAVGARSLELLPDGVSAPAMEKARQAIRGWLARCAVLTRPAVKHCAGERPRAAAVSAEYLVGVDGAAHAIDVQGAPGEGAVALVKQYLAGCVYTPAFSGGTAVQTRVREQFGPGK